MTEKPKPGAAFEDMYRQGLEENLNVLTRFPLTFNSALQLSEAMLPGEDATTNIKVKTAVSECLNALTMICKLSSDLEIMKETS
jgi:hypothetical protein